MNSERKCIVCKNTLFGNWFQKNNYQIKKCQKCGLAFIDPLPDNKIISELYSYEYFEKGKYKNFGYDGYLSKKKRHIANARRRLGYLLAHRQRGRLLDVGCGLGFFVKEASEKFQAEGIEISDYGVNYARDELKLNVKKGNLETADYAKDSFDIVTGYGIIEHVKDPSGFLKKAHTIIKKGGIIVLCSPNISCFNRYIQGKRWCGFRVPEHLYYFKPWHMKALLKEAGFEISRSKFVEENRFSDVMNIYGEKI